MKKISNIMFQGKPEEGKAMKFVAVVFVLALAVLTIPINAQAADTFHFRGESADAHFFSVNPPACDCNVSAGNGKHSTPACIFTDAFVFATDNKFQSPPGPGESSSFASFFIFQFDCTFTTLLVADCFSSTPLAAQDFQVGQTLESATLNTTLECFNFLSGTLFNVNVDLLWMGTGDLFRGNSHSHSSIPGCTFNSRFNGTFRPAEASGTVFDGITNFTPNPSDFAGISSAKSGDVVANCQ
ncbi:MAG: hypothetical protein ACREOW_11180 [Thermodesulfobacteriota bacterium]